ncbi:MAG: AraC family ligand binding domain-containing protein [Myxococcota bacterium]
MRSPKFSPRSRSAGWLLTIALGLGCTRDAPAWTTTDAETTFEVLGAEESVSIARVHLANSQTFRFAAGPCQEVLLLVEAGVARVDMDWFDTGAAARFNAPAVIQAMSDDGARLLVVAVTHVPGDVVAPSWKSAPVVDTCGPPMAPMVRAPADAGGPLVQPDSQFEAQVFLDGRDGSPRVASLVGLGSLAGRPTASVPSATHDSATVWWVDRGSGTMTLGTTERSIEPGTFVFVPPGTPQRFTPDGDEPWSAYQVYTPAGPEQRFRLRDRRAR